MPLWVKVIAGIAFVIIVIACVLIYAISADYEGGRNPFE